MTSRVPIFKIDKFQSIIHYSIFLPIGGLRALHVSREEVAASANILTLELFGAHYTDGHDMEKADVSVAKPVHTYVHGPEDCKPLWGTVTTGTYLVVWTLSLAAPFVAAGLLLSGQFRSGAALLLSIGVCYLPFWPKSPWLRKWYQGGNVGCFRRSSLLYEERLLDAAAPASTRKLLCVHPHGIFCMGWSMLVLHEAMRALSRGRPGRFDFY